MGEYNTFIANTHLHPKRGEEQLTDLRGEGGGGTKELGGGGEKSGVRVLEAVAERQEELLEQRVA